MRGHVLEIGEARYTPRFATAATTLDGVTRRARPRSVGDLTDPRTLPAAAFDAVICTQTLDVIYDVTAAVAGLHHLLASGGCALVTVSGIAQISSYDAARWGDYWRFTDASLRRLFDRFEIAAIEIRATSRPRSRCYKASLSRISPTRACSMRTTTTIQSRSESSR